MLVLQVVLHVAHLVVGGDEVAVGHPGALLDPGDTSRSAFRLTWVGTFAVRARLVLVLQEVLNVAHLVVRHQQLLHVHLGALLDPAEGHGSVPSPSKVLAQSVSWQGLDDFDSDGTGNICPTRSPQNQNNKPQLGS